ncbi:MAG: hypothetical protein JO043_08725 [Candidatus Eremiobacteraeota bacterium]|nr:hypothetical protein [Candidatus Eremiobacteraeota bacterium]
MVGWFGSNERERQGGTLTRFDLTVMSLISLMFGLALIVKGLVHGG